MLLLTRNAETLFLALDANFFTKILRFIISKESKPINLFYFCFFLGMYLFVCWEFRVIIRNK